MLGLYRPDLPGIVRSQSYHTLFVSDHLLLRSCLQQLKVIEVENMVLGHGRGCVQGKEACQETLDVGFRWVNNHQPGSLELLVSKVLFLRKFHIPF